MRHPTLRALLAVLLAAVAVFHVAEGALVLAGVCRAPADYGVTVFGGATFPMLLVAVVIGGSALLAAAAVLLRRAGGPALAGGAGAALIAWQVTDVVVARHFSAPFVAAGLVIVALAEYLAYNEAPSGQAVSAPGTRRRVALVVLEWFIAVGAIDGGLGLLRGALDQYISVAWLAGTPFRDFTVPALVLVIVVGGTALIAAATAFVYREWAVLASGLAGATMAGFLVVEAASIDAKLGDALPVAVGMQLLYFVPGVAIMWLARSLWRAEFGPRRLPPGAAWRPGPSGARPPLRAQAAR